VRHILILLSILLLLTFFLFSCERNKNVQTINFNRGEYVGEVEDGKPNGQGRITYKGEFKGHKYVGEWKDGLIYGKGTYTYSNGAKYVGEYKDGKKHGQGTLYYPSKGYKYEGEWKWGFRNGLGEETILLPDQSKKETVVFFKFIKFAGDVFYTKYVGGIKNGEPHGEGIGYIDGRNDYADNEIEGKIVGEWRDGKVWNAILSENLCKWDKPHLFRPRTLVEWEYGEMTKGFLLQRTGEKILGELCYQINESNLWNFIKRWCWYDEDDRGAWQSERRYFGEIDNGLPKGEGRFYEGDWPFPIDSYRDCLKDE